jgi:excisionase family DNA binding protein
MDSNLVFIADEARLLKMKDVAKILNISKSLAYRLTQTGEIPVVKVNSAVRVRLSDLNEFIKTRFISMDKKIEEQPVTK